MPALQAIDWGGVKVASYIRHKDFRLPSVTLVVPPLDSETGWTGELWSKTKFLILEKFRLKKKK